MHDELIIADASPLIAFVAIGELEVLRHIYHKISITDIVRSEIHTEEHGFWLSDHLKTQVYARLKE